MADASVTRLGDANQGGSDVTQLFLKVFAGEVMTKFEEKNIMLSKSKVRNIKSGKSAQFPLIGGISAEYHTPGEELTGLGVNHAEEIITIDDLLVSHAFIADIDEAMNHYEVRSEYSRQMGAQLAKQMDINVFIELIKAARASATLNDLDGGTEISNDNFQNDGGSSGASDITEQCQALASALFTSAQTLDEQDVPEEGRYAAFRPAEYYVLAQNTDLINKDFGGAGAIKDGSVLKVAGIDIVKSNNVPSTDTTSPSSGNVREHHNVDATKTIGTVWTPDAVGTVKLMDLSMQMEWDIRRQGTLMVARYAVGHDYLRPDCAIELKLDSLTN